MKNIYSRFSYLFDNEYSGAGPALDSEYLNLYFLKHALHLDEEFKDLYLSKNGLVFKQEASLELKLPKASLYEQERLGLLERYGIFEIHQFFMIDHKKIFQIGYVNPEYNPAFDNVFSTTKESQQNCYLVFGETRTPSHLMIGASPDNVGKIYHWPTGGWSDEEKPYFAYNSLSEMLSAVYED
jgi:hypothetical protein